MKIRRESAIGANESIKVEKKFRLTGLVSRTIYGNSKQELINKVVNREIYGLDTLQEYKNDRWTTIGKFKTVKM